MLTKYSVILYTTSYTTLQMLQILAYNHVHIMEEISFVSV